MASAFSTPRPFGVTAPPSTPPAQPRSLSVWMDRVLEHLHILRTNPGSETVHDLRVAIRRCRSIAAVMEEVDPHPAWRAMRKSARGLFRGLGDLRDSQVLEDWVKKISRDGDPIRALLLLRFASRENENRAAALSVASEFNTKKWKQLGRTLRTRSRIVPAGSLAAECLAFERFEEARALHAPVLRTEKPKPWHALRIGLKRFRYTVENFLPEHHAAWSDDLKRLQDLLGDIHDLDVLSSLIKDSVPKSSDVEARKWQERITEERSTRTEKYRQLTLGSTGLWNKWRHGLPHGQRLAAVAVARVRATARAADPHPRRTAQTARIAAALLRAVRRSRVAALSADPSFDKLFEAATCLHGVRRPGSKQQSHKAAQKLLMDLQLPPSWSQDDWTLLAIAVRYHRGAEPAEDRGSFARLTRDQQAVAAQIAGILRLARALRKSGTHRGRGIRAVKSSEALIIQIPELADSETTAARLAAAKHLLESSLGLPIILKSAVARPSAIGSRQPPSNILELATASD